MDASIGIWGGVECTVNRIGDSYRSQMVASGHDRRITDLDVFAGLKVSKLRYPVLWENVAPRAPSELNWGWSDQRLSRLQTLGVEPIVGLLHHGSGPIYTHLLDDAFPKLFGAYAGEVARRYPWVQQFTPINEPLTTARFSGLYGHWYPHARSDAAFARALVNQSRATVFAMRAIRSVNPRAQLVATDDLGQTFSTESIRYQADFDNERRWLGWDLISGKVDRTHPLFRYLLDSCVSRAELDWLCANPCPPDVIGINHYITSDRMLHEQWEHFPECTWGGNGRHQYADTEAVRVLDDYVPGFTRSMMQAWERYRTPVALTEVHLGCDIDDQVRWLDQAWRAAHESRALGVPVLAVTSWALLGSYDWNSLLTREEGHYEAGAFDVSSGVPRPTKIARTLRQLAEHGAHVLSGRVLERGWWEHESRITVRLTANA